MLKQCQDSHCVQFTQFSAMLAHHEDTRKASLWARSGVNHLRDTTYKNRLDRGQNQQHRPDQTHQGQAGR